MLKMMVMAVLCAVVAGAWTLVDKPAEMVPEVRAASQLQPPPADWVADEMPADAPAPLPTVAEAEAGFILFSRPLTDPIYPASRPRPDERVEVLTAFGTPGQFVTFNLAVYPLRPVRSLRVNWRPPVAGARSENRLVTYWQTRYPMYSSVGTYRTLPEYLFPVTVAEAPEGVPQRYFLTLQIPDGVASGVYHGEVMVDSEHLARAVQLPVRLEVFSFRLKKDPAKNYSAYQSDLGKPIQALGQEAMRRVFFAELERMNDYGFTRAPRLNLNYDAVRETYSVSRLDWMMEGIRRFGWDSTMAITGCGISQLYQKHTGVAMGSHHRYSIEPPEAMYEEMDRGLAAFRRRCEAEGYPRLIMGPLDEVDPSARAMALRVYGLFKKHGFDTFTTKDPVSDRSADVLDPVIDIWSSQPFSWSYDELQKQNKKGYWCYPNHNSYEIKNPVVMCKGGRMTYGFGHYRSGYEYLMPWIWRRIQTDFSAPALGGDSGANWMNAAGEVIMTTYWEAFRAGIDDAKYLYTLQDAIVKRRRTAAAAVAVAEAEAALQELWDRIPVRQKYLDNFPWSSEEFDAITYKLAQLTEKLLRYPESDPQAVSPSVLPIARTLPEPETVRELCAAGVADGSIEALVLPVTTGWRGVEQEARVIEVPENRIGDRPAVRLRVGIDLERDGSGLVGGSYPAGWPRLRYEVAAGQIDFSRYDFLSVTYRVKSNRNETRNVRTPFWCTIGNWRDGFATTPVAEVFAEGVSQQAVIALATLLGTASEAKRKMARTLDFGLTEREYLHGDVLEFDFADIMLLKVVQPKLVHPQIPGLVQRSAGWLRYQVEVFSASAPVGLELEAILLNSAGETVVRQTQVMERGSVQRQALALPETAPGRYRLQLRIRRDGQEVHRLEQGLELI